MSYVDVTFERGGTLVKTIARVSAGWDGSKPNQFYDQQFIDFRGDVTMRVAVWMSASNALRIFPLELCANYHAGVIKASLAQGRLSLSVPLQPDLPWIQTSNGKAAVDWQPGQIAVHGNIGFQLRHMIVFNLPNAKRGDYKEWDLLPFLSGGLIERNRRQH
jgi:hypothetical protein